MSYRFGILGCFYDCENYLPEVLSPWFRLKKELNLSITAVNCLFSEYSSLGYKNEDYLTQEIIKKNQFDYKIISPVPQRESEVRNLALSYLLYENVDFIWLLDGDEFYTEEQIRRSINFVKKNINNYWFPINFKNYIFDGKQWIDGFCPPRIFNNTLENKIDKFYWDNDIVYSNGKGYKTLKSLEIPREEAHVRHMTWLHSNGKKKVEYQQKHFGHCSYKWNDHKNELEFDLDFYSKRGLPFEKVNLDK